MTFERLLDAIYPRCCHLCGSRTLSPTNLCTGCLCDLPWIQHACISCGLPLAHALRCGACQRSRSAFSRTIAALRYARPVDRLVHAMKYRYRLDAATTLGQILAAYIQERGAARPECLIPVPLHRKRLRERGFNQALELSLTVASCLDIPVDYRSVIRCVDTKPQAELNMAQRRRNVRGAFQVQRPVASRHVAIVDDVMTSGNTCESLAKALLATGVRRIDVWVVARASRDQPNHS